VTNPVAVALQQALATPRRFQAIVQTNPSELLSRKQLANGVRPIVEAMLGVAEADTTGMHTALTQSSGDYQLRVGSITNNEVAVVFNNTEVAAKNNPDQSTWDLFGQGGGGSLNLLAVTANLTGSPEVALIMGKVPPFPSHYSDHIMPHSGLTSVSISAFRGEVMANSYRPQWNTAGLLRHALGLGDTSAVAYFNRSSWQTSTPPDISLALNFPGSYEYLAAHIHLLANYLDNLAAGLSQ
jgi:hypothetical protein